MLSIFVIFAIQIQQWWESGNWGKSLFFYHLLLATKLLILFYLFIYFFSPRDLHYIVFSKVAFTSTIFYLSSSDKYPLFLFSFINLRSFSRFIFLIPSFPNTLLFHNFKSCFRVCNLLVRTKLGVTWKLLLCHQPLTLSAKPSFQSHKFSNSKWVLFSVTLLFIILCHCCVSCFNFSLLSC